jgi:hypothetical protein
VQDIPQTDDAAPVGPSSEEEAAFLSEDRASAAAFVLPPKAGGAETGSGDAPLPPMEDLVKRIPAPARELIEDLFRARFVTVKRMPKTALKG